MYSALCTRRVKKSAVHNMIVITDRSCISEVNTAISAAVAKPIHNVVQNAHWPDVPSTSSSVEIDLTDQPGSWSAEHANVQLAQTMLRHSSMAHTMRVGRTLRPVHGSNEAKLSKVTI